MDFVCTCGLIGSPGSGRVLSVPRMFFLMSTKLKQRTCKHICLLVLRFCWLDGFRVQVWLDWFAGEWMRALPRGLYLLDSTTMK